MSECINQASDNSRNEQVIKVLQYWHLLEFFNPFNLDDACSRSSSKYLKIAPHELQSEYGNRVLPWLSATAIARAGGDPNSRYKHNLYLLPFNKNELTRISAECFPLDENPIKQVEFAERLEDEGETCFAQLSVNADGIADFATLSVATLPWALGWLTHGKLRQLNAVTYAAEQSKLKIALSELTQHIADIKSVVITDQIKPGTLTAQALLALLMILKKWAGFAPTHPLALIIELQEDKTIKANNNSTKRLPDKSGTTTANEQALEPKIVASQDSAADIDFSSENSTLPILNSFFIDDLEKVINYFATRQSHAAITAYINGLPEEERIDLYAANNSQFIIDKLQPQYLGLGRWPHDPEHIMSLMQQFAINECFYPSNVGTIFSVNGPPGTGKTTMFQDIIAENIVKRATILSELNRANDAFIGRENVKFSDGKRFNIGILHKQLTGYEMVVVSTNNAAVENISKDLPLQRKLGKKYRDTCRYLQPVALKALAQHKNKAVVQRHTANQDQPWGLIAVALGNSNNRQQFADRVFWWPDDKKDTIERAQANQYLTIWEWRRKYSGITFRQAKENFFVATAKLQEYNGKIYRLAELHTQLVKMNFPVCLAQQQSQLNGLRQQENILRQELEQLQSKIAIVMHEKDQAYRDVMQFKNFQPNLLLRLLRTAKAKRYDSQMELLQNIWLSLMQKCSSLKQELFQLNSTAIEQEKQITSVLKDIKSVQDKHDLLQTAFDSLNAELSGITLSPVNNGLTDEVEARACWQNPTLNELRTELFIAALRLHEAWLMEVMKSGYFKDNLFALAHFFGANNRTIKPSDEIMLWQSLFMWVPVVSSTFASIARQFKHVGAKQLGWLLIDEAGQATPQAAIGAMWRARHIVVVGDPLQIEPVFTTPANLIHGLAKFHFTTDYEQWLPTQTSVQVLADNANALGAYITVAEQRQWIGTPLRIHRRCFEPMFTIANTIAYENKMINARSGYNIDANGYPLGESAWFDIVAEATDKQYVAAQGELLLELCVRIYNYHKKLPKFYIITPFKRVKQNLRQLISNVGLWENKLAFGVELPKRSTLLRWCRDNIGTIHTFQGKEADAVILVLGADRASKGAVNWAAQKPNLLNVAVTRAKDRVYIIGDFELWAHKHFFSVAAQMLPRFAVSDTASTTLH